MLFKNNAGKILTSEEVDELLPWEIYDSKLHIYED